MKKQQIIDAYKKQQIIDAYCGIRTIDQTIPDEVLDFMKNAAIEKLNSSSIDIESYFFQKNQQSHLESHRVEMSESDMLINDLFFEYKKSYSETQPGNLYPQWFSDVQIQWLKNVLFSTQKSQKL